MDDVQLVEALRRLQHAANMLTYAQFCEAQGWSLDDYSRYKFREFQRMGRLHVFDDHALVNAIRYYERTRPEARA